MNETFENIPIPPRNIILEKGHHIKTAFQKKKKKLIFKVDKKKKKTWFLVLYLLTQFKVGFGWLVGSDFDGNNIELGVSPHEPRGINYFILDPIKTFDLGGPHGWTVVSSTRFSIQDALNFTIFLLTLIHIVTFYTPQCKK